jgi:hypothetical protein
VPVFFVLGDVYNPNAAPEILICLNKVGPDTGLLNTLKITLTALV